MHEEYSDLELAAKQLQQAWDSPDLWPRIAAGLQKKRHQPNPWLWTAAIAALLSLCVGLSVFWMMRKPAPASQLFLTQQAIEELDRAESAYLRSIERLSQLAAPLMEQPKSPLVGAYRDKISLLDQAIADLKREAVQNPYHAGLRTELRQLYYEKQLTLQEVLHHASNH